MGIQSPLIVFDDAINAIDHDHRSGIRETIFESDHFAQTQLIVTCPSPRPGRRSLITGRQQGTGTVGLS